VDKYLKIEKSPFPYSKLSYSAARVKHCWL